MPGTQSLDDGDRLREVLDFLIEIGVLATVVLVLALSIHLLRGSATEQPQRR